MSAESDESTTLFQKMPLHAQARLTAETDQAMAQNREDFDILFGMALGCQSLIEEGKFHSASMAAMDLMKTLTSFGEERSQKLVGLLLNALMHEVRHRFGVGTLAEVGERTKAGEVMFPCGPLVGRSFGEIDEEDGDG